MTPEVDLTLFPNSSSLTNTGHLTIAGHDLEQLASRHGTPLYIYDGSTIRHHIERLRSLLKDYYPGESMLAYASKAYFSLAMAQHLNNLGIGADVVSLGEIQVARKAGFSPERIHLHGNNKSDAELQAAAEWGIQAVVVDNLDELQSLERICANLKKECRIWLRITPDLEVDTHPHIETSNVYSKFGLHISNGEAALALQRALASRWLKLTGLHCHLGSQISDPEPYRQALDLICSLAQGENYVPMELSPGGGWGVRYTSEDPNDDAEPWVSVLSGAVQEACIRYDWPYPRLVLEPGRWLVARAGVALYRVGTKKTTPSGIRILSIDGGLADNPRVALYQSHYSACVVQRAGSPPFQKVRVAGKYCESGDVLIPEIALPEVNSGDLLAVPVAGAYQLSMASNYNYAPRPEVLWLEENQVEVMQVREKPGQDGWLVYAAD